MEDNVAQLLSVEFIQESKYLTVGHEEGVSVYTTTAILEDAPTSSQKDSGFLNIKDAVIVERLINTHLVLIVTRGEPRVMNVFHLTSKTTICKNKFAKPILSVKLNRERIVICMEDSIQIYGLKDMQLKHSILDTPTNDLGLIDLATSDSGSLIAYPGSASRGTVNIFNASQLTAVISFLAHEGPLAAMKFNNDGTMIATASDKGTVIRVFCATDGLKMFEFRRGVSRYVTIYSLAFSEDSKYLCSSSNTESVHVFKLEKAEEPEPTPETNGWFNYLTQVATSYLPTQVNELVTTERSFAIARLPGNEKKSIATMATIKGELYLLVATTDGYLYRYGIDHNGGDCNLIKQHKIGPDAENTSANASPRAQSPKLDIPNANDNSDFPPIHCSA